MPHIRTASRLHFGLFSLAPGGTHWPGTGGQPGLPVRRFGGVGLMVEDPGVRLRATPAPDWSAEGPLAERVLEFARRFAASVERDYSSCTRTPHRFVVERAAPEHAGLGTGTQLGLAVAYLLAKAWGLPAGAADLARRVGRGARSALGVHGFERGGFLVEAGKRGAELSPLVAHAPFPDEWRVVLALPSARVGAHGVREQEAFAQLAARAADLARTEALCRLVLLGMLPALAERDLPAFGEALYEFNTRVGEAFAPVQGGIYADERVANLVAFLRRGGIEGVGQSSWGPGVFAVVADGERAENVVRSLRANFGLAEGEAFFTRACNRGAPGWGPR